MKSKKTKATVVIISIISGNIRPVFVNMDTNEVANKQIVVIEIYGIF